MKMLVCTNKLNLAILHLYLFMTSYLIIFIYYILRDSQNQTNAAIQLLLQSKNYFNQSKSFFNDRCFITKTSMCVQHIFNKNVLRSSQNIFVVNVLNAGASYMLSTPHTRSNFVGNMLATCMTQVHHTCCQ